MSTTVRQARQNLRWMAQLDCYPYPHGFFPDDVIASQIGRNKARLARRRAAHRELKARRAALDTWQERMDGLRGDPT